MPDPFFVFFSEHLQCGKVTSGRHTKAGEVTVWASCSCGARVAERGTVGRAGGGREKGAPSELPQALDAFYLEHRRCGSLEAGLDEKGGARVVVWMSCSCGARFARDVARDNMRRSDDRT